MRPEATVVLPTIPAKRYFTIGEVSELCGVKPHVLRYWEQEFTQLKPVKRRGNRRYYQHHEVLLIRRIRELLYEQGFTISGARNRLSDPRGWNAEELVEIGRNTLDAVREELADIVVMLSAELGETRPPVVRKSRPDHSHDHDHDHGHGEAGGGCGGGCGGLRMQLPPQTAAPAKAPAPVAAAPIPAASQAPAAPAPLVKPAMPLMAEPEEKADHPAASSSVSQIPVRAIAAAPAAVSDTAADAAPEIPVFRNQPLASAVEPVAPAAVAAEPAAVAEQTVSDAPIRTGGRAIYGVDPSGSSVRFVWDSAGDPRN